MPDASPQSKFQFLPFVTSLAITLIIGFTASLVTRPQIAGWYNTLHKASFNPPAWLFPPVWTIIYILIAISAYLVWKKRADGRTYRITVIIYCVQLLLNFSWSILFFGGHHIFAALIVILLLWGSIVFNVVYFVKYSKTAGWLLTPYLLWVSFATALNFSIYLLNG